MITSKKMCKNLMKCDHCVENHETNRCSKDEIKITHKCINCEQTEHQVWARMCSVRQKEMKRVKRAYDICSVLYFIVIKNTTASMKQDNKMSFKNDFDSKKSRIEIQISQQNQEQQQKTSTKEKRILNNETEKEKIMKKNIRFLRILKTLKKYFNNRSIAISRNKEIAKKFITKNNRNINDAKKKDKLWVIHSKITY